MLRVWIQSLMQAPHSMVIFISLDSYDYLLSISLYEQCRISYAPWQLSLVSAIYLSMTTTMDLMKKISKVYVPPPERPNILSNANVLFIHLIFVANNYFQIFCC